MVSVNNVMSGKDSYEIVRGDGHGLHDVSEFLETLNERAEFGDFFVGDSSLTIARAPGRLDVMGGIADYSGSLVLELPIQEATLVALQKDNTPRLTIVSMLENQARMREFEMPLADLERDGQPISYDDARRYFKGNWAAYVAGVFLVLMRERGVRFDKGARLLISSSVPEGKGVSSSAALEVATMSAVSAAFEIEVGPRELALLCQRVENLVVGAPCGVMDQMTTACGEANQLLALVCQPAELLGTIRLPETLAVWGLDSGTRHSIGAGDYGSVRAGAFMGYRIIAGIVGFPTEQIGKQVRVTDPRWNGYLANLDVGEFEEKFAPKLPKLQHGGSFLNLYHGTTDPVTSIDPERTYAVYAPTAHAVYENHRVRRFADLLRGPLKAEEKVELGELMYESHASYSACGLGSKGTDLLVELVKTKGAELFGAKITGGGSGGTVAVLGNADAEEAVIDVARTYAGLTGHQPYIFRGSSPGSAAFGHLVVKRG